MRIRIDVSELVYKKYGRFYSPWNCLPLFDLPPSTSGHRIINVAGLCSKQTDFKLLIAKIRKRLHR